MIPQMSWDRGCRRQGSSAEAGPGMSRGGRSLSGHDERGLPPATEALLMFGIVPAGPGQVREGGSIVVLTAMAIDVSMPVQHSCCPGSELWEAPAARGRGGC